MSDFEIDYRVRSPVYKIEGVGYCHIRHDLSCAAFEVVEGQYGDRFWRLAPEWAGVRAPWVCGTQGKRIGLWVEDFQAPHWFGLPSYRCIGYTTQAMWTHPHPRFHGMRVSDIVEDMMCPGSADVPEDLSFTVIHATRLDDGRIVVHDHHAIWDSGCFIGFWQQDKTQFYLLGVTP